MNHIPFGTGWGCGVGFGVWLGCGGAIVPGCGAKVDTPGIGTLVVNGCGARVDCPGIGAGELFGEGAGVMLGAGVGTSNGQFGFLQQASFGSCTITQYVGIDG